MRTRPSAARKGKGGFTFGYKAHVGVDEGSGLIRSVITTPANVNDTVPADALIRGDEKAVWADAAYHTHARAPALKARGHQGPAGAPGQQASPRLPPRLKRYNRLIARRRAAVETTFATLKHRMGLTRIRYVGLVKARPGDARRDRLQPAAAGRRSRHSCVQNPPDNGKTPRPNSQTPEKAPKCPPSNPPRSIIPASGTNVQQAPAGRGWPSEAEAG